MSEDIAIRVQNLGKRYRIGLKDELHDTFAGMLGGWLKSPITNYRRLRSLSHFDGQESSPQRRKGREGEADADDFESLRSPRLCGESNSDDTIWALSDVSFEVKKGEVLGIIGRNGAGKSTLLKILSRITEPSTGRVEIHGRIASLLEVGTGFHSELSGRDNVYLNGTILGMTKKEIDTKFDEIVSFSGVEKFIDTPVKRYSSGMRVRLAFAVAAHLDPEILLVDEVLAVGDIEFQKKCLGKMSEVARCGRTVLFVSHNLAAVSQLCQSGLLLGAGRIVKQASIGEVITTYGRMVADRKKETTPQSGESIEIRNLRIMPERSEMTPSTQLTFCFELEIRKSYWNLFLLLIITTPEGAHLVINSLDSKQRPELLQPGRYDMTIALPSLWLSPKSYSSRIKAVAHPESGTTERFYSDWKAITINGGHSVENMTEHTLSPDANWSMKAIPEEAD